MMSDIDEKDRYGLFGLVIGLQTKDLPLVTENLLKVCEESFLCQERIPCGCTSRLIDITRSLAF